MHEAKLQGRGGVVIRRKKADTLADLRDGVVRILAFSFLDTVTVSY